MGGVVDGDGSVRVTGPAFLDSRAPEPGGLFVALAGEHVDGHDFAAGAVEGGAAGVLGSQATGVPTVVVADVQAALQELARQVLRRLWEHDPGPKVVAITGSQGKTTAKDMLARVLADAGPTVATAGSFNNELGLPLTVLRATGETRYLVLEMGARGIGHLAELCEIAPPDISLVLNVGKAHIGEFGSQENIALAKGELVEALSSGRPRGPQRRRPPRGRDGRADARPGSCRSVVPGPTSCSAASRSTTSGARPSTSPTTGRPSTWRSVWSASTRPPTRRRRQRPHWPPVSPWQVWPGACRAIERLSPWRMEVHERADGLVVLNDAYNANPDSMASAVQTLARMGERGRPADGRGAG